MNELKTIQLHLHDEGQPIKIITFRIDLEADERLNKVTAEQGLSKSATIRAILKYGLEVLDNEYKSDPTTNKQF
jgi:predicted DNA-binding protein